MTGYSWNQIGCGHLDKNHWREGQKEYRIRIAGSLLLYFLYFKQIGMEMNFILVINNLPLV
ncbi:MAG: hypothetical protein A3F83_01130 [Candidatus Glassbacteria bacterium RIFCSPLOWO2_12_FULL_58_11]|uniref:Uncharacterized protein n=1 Tax=Candidatus Glassbacteria bacterium RIFCSPLOWO2_12_FULL_58_11 TaxID=1817867 RepID=A0A1F5YTW6_9BACT|nr:MAG: hypothetical protein A3F83_01130 [Candidatus Glassbacteria bacterium RIFCSPLOWO2_12_FULL_58_11]